MMRRLRLAANVCALAALTCGGLILAGLGLSQMLGYESLTVMSGSMEPHIHVGDLVLTERVAPLRVHPGDVITFRDPQNNARLITHRVQSIRLVGVKVRFVTKGDANTGVEHWSINADGAIGLVSYRVVGAGYALVSMRSPLGRLGLIILPALLLGGQLVYRIWRPKEKERFSGEPAY